MKKYYIILIAFLGCLGLQAKDMTGLKIYINPGHGGYDSDDRNVAVYPYAQGDTLGFWESSSNLHKGLMLRELLQEQGATVAMSRVLNRTEDDRGLETIGQDVSKWEADLFFSIHSNATGTSRRDNFPMMLFRGYTENPVKPEDKVAAKILFKRLLEKPSNLLDSNGRICRGRFSFLSRLEQCRIGSPPKINRHRVSFRRFLSRLCARNISFAQHGLQMDGSMAFHQSCHGILRHRRIHNGSTPVLFMIVA